MHLIIFSLSEQQKVSNYRKGGTEKGGAKEGKYMHKCVFPRNKDNEKKKNNNAKYFYIILKECDEHSTF